MAKGSLGTAMVKQAGLIGLVALCLAACSAREPDLITVQSNANDGEGPDEFGILPTKPLEAPEDYSFLPTPTPGGRNLVDPTPEADAVAALGGNPAVLTRASTDGGLVRYAGRFGVSSTIPSELAASDLAFRQQNPGRVLERLFDITTYFTAYEAQSLDKYRELERFRRAGIRTPAVPPLLPDE